MARFRSQIGGKLLTLHVLALGVTAQVPEDYTGTIVSRGGAEHKFVSLWSNVTGSEFAYWSSVKELCDSPDSMEAPKVPFSTIQRIDFETPSQEEMKGIRSCKKNIINYDERDCCYNPRKATITMGNAQKNSVFLYVSGTIAYEDKQELFLENTRQVTSVIITTRSTDVEITEKSGKVHLLKDVHFVLSIEEKGNASRSLNVDYIKSLKMKGTDPNPQHYNLNDAVITLMSGKEIVKTLGRGYMMSWQVGGADAYLPVYDIDSLSVINRKPPPKSRDGFIAQITDRQGVVYLAHNLSVPDGLLWVGDAGEYGKIDLALVKGIIMKGDKEGRAALARSFKVWDAVITLKDGKELTTALSNSAFYWDDEDGVHYRLSVADTVAISMK